jgi:hypothetical protein
MSAQCKQKFWGARNSKSLKPSRDANSMELHSLGRCKLYGALLPWEMKTLRSWKLQQPDTLCGSTLCGAGKLGSLKLSRDSNSVELDSLWR